MALKGNDAVEPFYQSTKGKVVIGVVGVSLAACSIGVIAYLASRKGEDEADVPANQQGQQHQQQQGLLHEQEHLSEDTTQALDDHEEFVELGKTKGDSSLAGVDEAIVKKLAKASPEALEKVIKQQPQEKQTVLRDLVANVQTREKALEIQAQLSATPEKVLTSAEAAILKEATSAEVGLNESQVKDLKSKVDNLTIAHKELSLFLLGSDPCLAKLKANAEAKKDFEEGLKDADKLKGELEEGARKFFDDLKAQHERKMKIDNILATVNPEECKENKFFEDSIAMAKSLGLTTAELQGLNAKLTALRPTTSTFNVANPPSNTNSSTDAIPHSENTNPPPPPFDPPKPDENIGGDDDLAEKEEKNKARDVALDTFTKEVNNMFKPGYDVAQLPAKFKAIKDAYLAVAANNPADPSKTNNIKIEKDEDVVAYFKTVYGFDTSGANCAALTSGRATFDADQLNSGTLSVAAVYSDLRTRNKDVEAKKLLNISTLYYDFYYMFGVAEAAVEKKKLEDAVSAADEKIKKVARDAAVAKLTAAVEALFKDDFTWEDLQPNLASIETEYMQSVAANGAAPASETANVDIKTKENIKDYIKAIWKPIENLKAVFEPQVITDPKLEQGLWNIAPLYSKIHRDSPQKADIVFDCAIKYYAYFWMTGVQESPNLVNFIFLAKFGENMRDSVEGLATDVTSQTTYDSVGSFHDISFAAVYQLAQLSISNIGKLGLGAACSAFQTYKSHLKENILPLLEPGKQAEATHCVSLLKNVVAVYDEYSRLKFEAGETLNFKQFLENLEMPFLEAAMGSLDIDRENFLRFANMTKSFFETICKSFKDAAPYIQQSDIDSKKGRILSKLYVLYQIRFFLQYSLLGIKITQQSFDDLLKSKDEAKCRAAIVSICRDNEGTSLSKFFPFLEEFLNAPIDSNKTFNNKLIAEFPKFNAYSRLGYWTVISELEAEEKKVGLPFTMDFKSTLKPYLNPIRKHLGEWPAKCIMILLANSTSGEEADELQLLALKYLWIEFVANEVVESDLVFDDDVDVEEAFEKFVDDFEQARTDETADYLKNRFKLDFLNACKLKDGNFTLKTNEVALKTDGLLDDTKPKKGELFKAAKEIRDVMSAFAQTNDLKWVKTGILSSEIEKDFCNVNMNADLLQPVVDLKKAIDDYETAAIKPLIVQSVEYLVKAS